MDDLPIDGRVILPGWDLTWRAVRASGPGGQNVNKVATKVELRFDLPGTAALSGAQKARLRALAGGHLDADGRLVIVSQATRTQARNLEDARARLAELVHRALRPPKARRPTAPSRSQKRRRLDAKRKQSDKKKARGPVRGDD